MNRTSPPPARRLPRLEPLRKVYRFVKVVLLVLLSLVEVPLFLLRNRALFGNRTLFILWHWSFGHTLSGLDFAVRLYHPRRLSVILLPNPRNNVYLPECFRDSIDYAVYRSIWPPRPGTGDESRYVLLRAALLIIAALTRRFHLAEREDIYQTLSLAGDGLQVGYEESGKVAKATDYTGYVRLLQERVGRPPRMPEELEDRCHRAIRARHPKFLDRPFVTILLREKGKGGFLDDAFRCSGPQENYLPAVKEMIAAGYHVLGTGETRHAVFAGIQGYYSMSDVDLPGPLLNLYALMKCSLFVGQQSGPHILPNSCGIPCLIVDAMPYRIGTFIAEDIILFKPLRRRSDGKVLDAVEIFLEHKDLALGYNFATKGVDIEHNSPEDILEATREALALLRGDKLIGPEEADLIERFRALPALEMTLRYHRTRPPLFVLRRLKPRLMQAAWATASSSRNETPKETR